MEFRLRNIKVQHNILITEEKKYIHNALGGN